MGTRGLIILILKRRIITLYNHWDSYPHGLGRSLVEQLLRLLDKYRLEKIAEIIDSVKIVSEEVPPTFDEINQLEKYSDSTVSTCKLTEWYCLLRKCQGSIELMIECGYALGTEYDNIDEAYQEAKDCWADFVYTFDFDSNEFLCNKFSLGLLTEINFDWIDRPLSSEAE